MMNAKKYPVKVGIIGGTGIDNPNILENRMERRVNTPYGEPSDILIEGKIRGVDCVLLARHGRRHTIMPSKVNFRANIWALKSLGCTHVVASTATGSLRENINPGDMVILDSFIDRTTKRQQTFYDGEPTSPPGICHLPMEPAFCPETRTLLINAAEALQFKCHRFGTCVAIEGPRFSSKAESTMFRAWGGDVINMTTCPEVVLAKEAGLCYAAVALVTDYDCWREQEDSVCVSDVMRVMKHNSGNMVKLLIQVIPEIAKKNWDETIDNLRALITSSIMLP